MMMGVTLSLRRAPQECYDCEASTTDRGTCKVVMCASGKHWLSQKLMLALCDDR